ncbi:MAG: biotin-dependent carboxyltransferase family protein [Alphaproteobacteria bacterium]|nr:biotin-dependent carboxyltransferase family protein [Alphaproteobacteria bacterium]
MSVLKVITPGISTIQDHGRFGLQRYGVAPAGAMDRTALRRANELAGCKPGTPTVETGPLPATFEVSGAPIRIAVTGAPRQVSISGRQAALDQTHLLRDGERLAIGSARGGMFSYISFEGGLLTEAQLTSSSLDERAGFGSPFKRPLQTGDFLEVTPATIWPSERSAAIPSSGLSQRNVIRVILGPQDDYFFPETIDQFLNTRWRVGLNSNRMCFTLDGPLLAHAKGYNIVSDGTVRGSIQIAGDGQPFVLLADRGTVGGYPKIATLATVDMDRFVQIPAGGEVRFEAVSVERAQALLRTQASRGTPAMRDAGTVTVLNEAALSSANLAGAATNALEPAAFEY